MDFNIRLLYYYILSLNAKVISCTEYAPNRYIIKIDLGERTEPVRVRRTTTASSPWRPQKSREEVAVRLIPVEVQHDGQIK